MKYVYHDGCVLRRVRDFGPVDLFRNGEWVPFPEPKDGDIRQSAVAAWFEGSPLSKQQAKELMDGQNKSSGTD